MREGLTRNKALYGCCVGEQCGMAEAWRGLQDTLFKMNTINLQWCRTAVALVWWEAELAQLS